MTDERSLSKIEACFGLGLLASLLAALVGAYVYRYDQPPPIAPPDPHWTLAQPAAAASSPVEQPQWLSLQDQPLPQAVARYRTIAPPGAAGRTGGR
jgi:hypothetical protein